MEGQFDQVIEVIKKRSNRASATILGVKEREADQYLPQQVSTKLRKVVLDQVNELADLAVDCLRGAADSDSEFNDKYFDLLGDMHEMLVEIAERE